MTNITGFTFLSTDGKTQLHGMRWEPEGRSVRAVLQICHGVAEHIARYDAFARYLNELGIAVVGHDHLGHGRSLPESGTPVYFGEGNTWHTVVDDIYVLHQRIRLWYPDVPLCIMGHSMGSFLTRTYLIRFRTGLDGAVISGTGHQSPALVSAGKVMSAIDIRRNGSMHKSDFLNKMAFGTYNDKFENPRTSSDWLSRDEAAVDLYNEDPLCGFVPTAGLLHDMMNGIAFVIQPKNIARMKKDLPILFVSGDCDPVGEQGRGVIRAYKCFLKAGMKDVTMKLYHGGRHEMLNETNRAEVYEDVLSWLNSKTGK